MSRVAAIIPARGGSKGVTGKNLRKVGGYPLVARAVLAALGSSAVQDIYVSSDNQDILDVGGAYGARAIRRPDALSGDQASSESALLHALDVMEAAGRLPDILIMIQCTSPFVMPADLTGLVDALADDRFDAAFTATPDHGFLWTTTDDGEAVGINHNEREPRKRRQELPPQYLETGAAYAMRVAAFRRAGRRYCGRVKLVVQKSWPVEIDTHEDLALARALASLESSLTVHPTALGQIKVLVTDFDGVHTDDAVYVNQDGVEQVKCSRSDGLGIEQLRKSGVPLLILSKETNPVVQARGRKLNVEVIHGADEKHAILLSWLGRHGLDFSQVAYIGNDMNDVPCLKAAGVSFAPEDAHTSALQVADFVLSKPGGRGAVRQVCDMLLEARKMVV